MGSMGLILFLEVLKKISFFFPFSFFQVLVAFGYINGLFIFEELFMGCKLILCLCGLSLHALTICGMAAWFVVNIHNWNHLYGPKLKMIYASGPSTYKSDSGPVGLFFDEIVISCLSIIY